MNTLWAGTPFEQFAANVLADPAHRLAYFMGQVDQTIYEVMGVEAEADNAPDEARQVALLMMQAIAIGGDKMQAAEDAQRIIRAFQKRIAAGAH